MMSRLYGMLTRIKTATYLIHDLCDYPQYADILRSEMLGSLLEKTPNSLEDLELVDSFIAESARISCFDAGKAVNLNH